MLKIHHNTTKRADRAGLVIKVADDDQDSAVALRGTLVLSRGPDPKVVLDEALQQLNGGEQPKRSRKAQVDDNSEEAEVDEDEVDEADDSDGDEDEAELKSVVKPKYRKIYKPHDDSCGDSLHRKIENEFTEGDDFDWPRFIRFAKANGCWVGSYASLNNGMKMMNVRNRLSKKVRDKVEIDWNVR